MLWVLGRLVMLLCGLVVIVITIVGVISPLDFGREGNEALRPATSGVVRIAEVADGKKYVEFKDDEIGDDIEYEAPALYDFLATQDGPQRALELQGVKSRNILGFRVAGREFEAEERPESTGETILYFVVAVLLVGYAGGSLVRDFRGGGDGD